MDDERVTVVTVAYRSAATLGIFLDTLERATSRPSQVIVVDNCPADGSVREIVGGRQNIQIIANEANIGYGAAANRGIAQTDTRLVMLANPDVVWDTDSIDVLMTAVTRWPRGAAFGPLIRTPEGTTYPSARRLPSLGAGVGHALLGRLWPNNPWTASYRQQDREPVERTAEWLSGSCLLLVRSSFDAIGGFDPDYFMYFEDVDLGERLGKDGWQSVYVPGASVVHIGGQATSLKPASMVVAHHRSAWRYLSRRYRGRRWLAVRAVLRVGLAARSAIAVHISRRLEVPPSG